MYQKFKILILSVVVLLSISINEAKSQSCPTNYSSTVKVLNINGCDYEVHICFKCGLSTAYSDVRVYGFTRLDPNCNQTWTTDQVLEYIWDYLVSDEFINFVLEDCNIDLPPCDVPFMPDFYITRIEDVCWYKTNIGGLIYYYPCYWEQVYCETIWKLCVDQNGQIRLDPYYGPAISGNVGNSCPSSIEPSEPAPNQQTGCFNVKTLCSPY